MLVAEEQKDHFKNALAVEVALAEQICLRTLTKEIEEAVLQVSSGPTELIRQRQRSKQLHDTANQLKKKIALYARKNVLLDKKLEEINRFIFEGDVTSVVVVVVVVFVLFPCDCLLLTVHFYYCPLLILTADLPFLVCIYCIIRRTIATTIIIIIIIIVCSR